MSCLWNKKKEVAVGTRTTVFRMRISSASGYGSSTRYFGQDVPIRRQDRRGNSMSSLRIPDFKSGSIKKTVSDALVFFGATGDLAHKKIFPALQRLAKRGRLDIPVIGVAKAGWNLEQLKQRAKDSVEHYGGLDPEGFPRLMSVLQYVDGDYADPATFVQLRKLLGQAQHPIHYLAIPPSLFAAVVKQLKAAGCT